jgi:hypothetical protein
MDAFIRFQTWVLLKDIRYGCYEKISDIYTFRKIQTWTFLKISDMDAMLCFAWGKSSDMDVFERFQTWMLLKDFRHGCIKKISDTDANKRYQTWCLKYDRYLSATDEKYDRHFMVCCSLLIVSTDNG